MNILKSVSAKIWSGVGSPELANLDGKLYLSRTPLHSLREARSVGKECLFLDAVASIRKVDSYPYAHELVITKAYESGAEELLDDDDGIPSDELTFLIGAELGFKRDALTREETAAEGAGLAVLRWDATDGDSSRYEFVVAKGNLDAFETHLCRALYERQFQRNADQATPQQLEAIKAASSSSEWATPRDPLPKKKPASPKKPAAAAKVTPESDPEGEDEVEPSDSDDDQAIQESLVAGKMSGLNLGSDGTGQPAASTSAAAQPAPEHPPPPPVQEEEETVDVTQVGHISPLPLGSVKVLEETVDLYLHDLNTSTFLKQSDQAKVTLWNGPAANKSDNSSWFTVTGPFEENPEILWITAPLKPDQSIYFREIQSAMVFTLHNPADDTNYTWCLRCDKEAFVTLNEAFSRAVFESNNGAGSFKKLSPAEQRYNQESYVRPSAMDLDDVEEEEEDAGSDEEYESAPQEQDTPEEEDQEEEEESEEEEDSDEESQQFKDVAAAKRSKNSQLAVGHKEDLTFVVRGDIIGVFREQASGGKKLKFTTSIAGLTTPDGKPLNPSQVMLHHGDSQMLLRDPLNPQVAYTLDLERGQVTDTLALNGRDIVNFLPESKFAQLTPEQTFIGHSHNAIYRVDPRLSSKDKVIESQCKTYAGKLNFVSASTTETGEIATLTDKGELRLYDALGKNAKTALPAIGSGAFHTDVTKDGRWIVITQRDHLLVVDATIKDGRYSGESGFHRSFPADKKARPMRLELKPEHKAYLKSDMHFTQARFNTGPDQTESHIVTSSGPYIISWNFRHVKNGKLDSYTIRKYDENVVADQFKFNDKKDIIVTLGDNVLMENRKNLAKPTRESLGGDIVKHWR